MIPRTHRRAADAEPVLSDALGRALSYLAKLAESTVVARWAGMDACTADDDPASWTSVDWAEHVNDPLFEHPSVTSPEGDRRAVFHIDVRLAPCDRSLTAPEWAEIAHRIARAAGIAAPGGEQGCRWIAVQAHPHRVDLIANLIRLDGTWQQLPSDLLRRLAAEARRLEDDLGLISPQHPAAPHVPDPARQAPMLLAQVRDETFGPLAGARSIVEHLAQRLVGHPQAHVREAGHRLEWTARRLLALQQDLTATATILNSPPGHAPAAPTPGSPALSAAARTGHRPMT